MEKKLKDVLRQRGLKVTPLRLTVLALFYKTKKPLDVEGIQKKARGSDHVTLYRTLESFSRSRIIKRVDLRKKSVYYELNHSHHHHIVCKICGLVEDFKVCMAEKLINPILTRSSKFTSVLDHSFEFFGVCNVCSKS